MVSIPACHAGDRGSIPRQRVDFFLFLAKSSYGTFYLEETFRTVLLCEEFCSTANLRSQVENLKPPNEYDIEVADLNL